MLVHWPCSSVRWERVPRAERAPSLTAPQLRHGSFEGRHVRHSICSSVCRSTGSCDSDEHGVSVKWGHSFVVATTWKNKVGDRKSAVCLCTTRAGWQSRPLQKKKSFMSPPSNQSPTPLSCPWLTFFAQKTISASWSSSVDSIVSCRSSRTVLSSVCAGLRRQAAVTVFGHSCLVLIQGCHVPLPHPGSRPVTSGTARTEASESPHRTSAFHSEFHVDTRITGTRHVDLPCSAWNTLASRNRPELAIH